MTGVPLLDLKAQFAAIEPEIRAAIDGVLASQRFILGPEVEALEREVAAYSGAAHGIGVSSGTDALLLALMALDVKPGDEVITTPYTFFATAGVVARLGAVPRFVDIDPATYNIDPAGIEAAITPKTRVILPVHLFGQCADMDPIMEIARARNLHVVEDAAQAIGAEYKGRRAGSIGDIGCFSFFPSKNLGAFGDGGMCVTNSAELAHRMKILRVHGAEPKYFHKVVGGNFRLDVLQAAILRVKLRHLDDWSAARRRNADLYERKIRALGLPESVLSTPAVRESRHVFNQYVLRTPDRDGAVVALAGRGIGTEIYYPLPLHLQPCFANLGHGPGSFPAAERAARETFAVPIYPELTETEIDLVVGALAVHFKTKAHVA